MRDCGLIGSRVSVISPDKREWQKWVSVSLHESVAFLQVVGEETAVWRCH